jgi:chromosome condensin MukBEF ATPase and DNA-binding subunit MukB
LPEYEEKIANARTDAQHALEEEVIHRLRERLREVKRQFNDLNSALEGLEFSKRSYKFTYRVREEYRRFYDMVMEAGQPENQPLFEANWHREYGSGPLQDLLNEILGERGQREIKDLEQRTDYRAYFDYDIEITDAQGDKSLFSRSAGSGSGGETQTPYYVAMLASMARLYRTRDENGNRAAILAFDEPFQKMDERNIAGTIELARRMNLQLFLATPKERCDLMLPALGRATCLLVLRDGDDVLLEPFQKNSVSSDGKRAPQPSPVDESTVVGVSSGEAGET